MKILVSHYKNHEWFEIQIRNFERFAHGYEVVATFDWPGPWQSPFTWSGHYYPKTVEEHINDHGDRLNHLADLACAGAPDNEWLLFIDSDVVLLERLVEFVRFANECDKPIVAPRFHHLSLPCPCPAFCAFQVGHWRALPGDWRYGIVRKKGKVVSDTGGQMLTRIKARDWYVLEGRLSPYHPYLFETFYLPGVHRDGTHGRPLAFHCGAGTRRPVVSRYERQLRRECKQAFRPALKRNLHMVEHVTENLKNNRQPLDGMESTPSWPVWEAQWR